MTSTESLKKYFTNFPSHQVHQTVHTNIHPHQCPVCDERIQNAVKLCKHVRQHNGMSGKGKGRGVGPVGYKMSCQNFM